MSLVCNHGEHIASVLGLSKFEASVEAPAWQSML